MDVIEQSIKGCNSKGGMPKIFVNPDNLNVVVEDVDLSYSGLGPKMEIKRTYNADDPRDSIFGRSWTFNYNVSVTEAPNGLTYVRRGSGKIDTYTLLGGVYYPPKGVYDELVKKTDGTYSLWIKKDRVTQNFDTDGKLVSIVDQNDNAITFQNEWVNRPTTWGSSGPENGQFNNPRSLAVDQSGYVYVADANNHRIQKFNRDGAFVAKWGSYGSGDGQFSFPYGVAVDQSGYVYVTEVGNDRVQKFDSSGNFITKWGSYGKGDGQFINPWAVAVDPSGYVYVGEYDNEYSNYSRVQKFTNSGSFLLEWSCWNSCSGTERFLYVGGLAADQWGNIFVSDTGNSRMHKFDTNGTHLLSWGSSIAWPMCSPKDGNFHWPEGVAVDQWGNVYVADTDNNRVQKFDNNGTFLMKWGNFVVQDSQFLNPRGVGVDQSGNLFVADTSNNRIKKFLSNLPSGVFLNSITDAAGRVTTFEYENYKVRTITNEIEPQVYRQALFEYDDGNLWKQTDMAGIVTTYTYNNPQSYMTHITTPQGTTVLMYESSVWYPNLLSKITDPKGNQRQYARCYYFYSGDVCMTDARMNTLYYHHDTNNFCGTKNLKDAINNTTSFGYNGNCDRTSIEITNPGNPTYTTTIGYNTHGDITFIKDPVCADLGCQTTFTYWNDQTYLKEIIDPRDSNYKYTFEYSQDGKWNLKFIKAFVNNAQRTLAEFRYDDPPGKGLPSHFIDGRGNMRTFTYDSHGNLETVTGPAIGSPPYSLTTIFGYDEASRLTSITDPRGNITRYEYDGIDRITKITYPDGKTVEYTYFCCGQSSVKDENGKTTSYQPHADNRLWKIFDPVGGVTEFDYDGNGNLIKLIDAENQTTKFTYFPLADRLQKIFYPEDPYPNGTPEEFDYYPVGTLKWKKNRKLEQTDYGYNKNNQLTNLTSSGISIGYGYDRAGNINSMADATGPTTFEHDELNRLKYVVYPGGKRIDYTYNEVGKLETITTAFGIVVYNYDAYNRLSTITLPNAAGIIDYHYDENNYKGNLTSVHYPNGTYTTYGYDNRNRLVSLTNNGPGGIISQYTYTLDGVGNKINISVEEPLSWTALLGSIDYGYDPGNFLTSAGTATYQYDLNGNLYTKTRDSITTTHTFDSQDRLTSVSSPSLNMQYQYDGLFNRVSKTASGTVTRYLVDPNGVLPQVIAEMDGGNNITDYYVYDGMGLVAKISGSNVYYYHYDGSTNTIAMTDSSGNMINKYAYDEFGSLLNAVETVPNPFTFVGRYGVMDDDSGLLYMRARYYDPEVGRFISKDPIRYLGGDPNLYCYVRNNPVNWVDPSGELFSPLGAAVGGIVGGISGGIIASFDPNASLGSIATAVAVGAAGGAIGGLFDVSMGAAAGLGAGIGAGTAVVNGSNIGGIIGGAMGGAIGGAFVIISGGGIVGVATGAYIGAWNAWLFEKAGNAIYNEWIKKDACSAY